ncbi:MAG: high-potential iron-sulfur protein [Burkholderiales bacterium]|nr:high-potential iron-sulfur protein [Burkholderiales bacterium]
MSKQISSGRRRLLQGVLALIPIGAFAQSPGKRVEESEPQAQGLGYKRDASKADKAKFKNFRPGETCAGCRFYKGAAGETWGPCEIFGNRLVNANGWCSAWMKKT